MFVPFLCRISYQFRYQMNIFSVGANLGFAQKRGAKIKKLSQNSDLFCHPERREATVFNVKIFSASALRR